MDKNIWKDENDTSHIFENSVSFSQPDHETLQPKKQKHGLLRRTAFLVVFGLLCSFGGAFFATHLGVGGSPVFYQAVKTAENNTNNTMISLTDVVKSTANSVVEVRTETVSTNPFIGQSVESGAGSGVILTTDGYIITNNHVVSGANNLRVTLKDGTSYTATLVGADSKTDIAVIKIQASGLIPAIIGDSDALQVGEVAIAIGNPLGTLGGTVTNGIISALNRDVTIGGETMNLMQTNAAVNPGNSGGGLFNVKGELIGIVNAKSSGSGVEGLGFAVPINIAHSVAAQLIENGYVTGRPAIGITVLDLDTAERAASYGVQKIGVYIYTVNKGTDAEKQGLKNGDYIVSINETAIESMSDITSILAEKAVGDQIEMQVIRGGKTLSFKIILLESKPNNTVS